MGRTAGWITRGAVFAALCIGAGAAADDLPDEYLTPPVVTVPAPPGSARAAPPARRPVRPGAYAPEAALNASRLSLAERDERYFLRTAAMERRFLAEASKLALARAPNPAVCSLAGDVLREQEASAPMLLRMLHAREMAMPMIENADRKTLNRLAKLNGARFEREYLAQLALRLERSMIPLYERSGTLAQEPVLKGWIEDALPALRNHQVLAGKLSPPRPVAQATAPPAAAPPRARPPKPVAQGARPPATASNRPPPAVSQRARPPAAVSQRASKPPEAVSQRAASGTRKMGAQRVE